MTSGSLKLYRACTPVVDSHYDTESDQTPVEAIIDALTEAADIEATALPPLYEIVDTDALNQMFGCHKGADVESVLSFTLETWNVFIRGDGRIRVCDATKPTDPAPVFASVTG